MNTAPPGQDQDPSLDAGGSSSTHISIGEKEVKTPRLLLLRLALPVCTAVSRGAAGQARQVAAGSVLEVCGHLILNF
jgi:hypothetical protein